MLDLFLAVTAAFGSESVGAIGFRSKSSCSGGVCSSSAPVAVESKKVEAKTNAVVEPQHQFRFKFFNRGKRCR